MHNQAQKITGSKTPWDDGVMLHEYTGRNDASSWPADERAGRKALETLQESQKGLASDSIDFALFLILAMRGNLHSASCIH